jgi:hypothetical protein
MLISVLLMSQKDYAQVEFEMLRSNKALQLTAR